MTNPYAPPLASVRDIVEQRATSEPAERSTRLGAAILDSLIGSVMITLPMIVGIMIGSGVDASTGGDGTVMVAITMLFTLIGVAAWVAMTVKRVRANGQSIGKKYCGIKVVRMDGSPASLGRIIWLRNVVNAVIGVIPIYGLIDILFIFGESRRCLHDMIADTIVIKA